MKVLVTGGAGFIGSNFVHYMLEQHPEDQLVVLDKLTYAGNLANLKDVMKKIRFIRGDICDRKLVEKVAGKVNAIVNFAAETHVDRSIAEPGPFLDTNIIGTQVLLEAARKFNHEKFIQISTDEVYGSIIRGSFKETDPLKPSSPYSASKAAADLLAYSYFITYGVPSVIVRSTNNFGPHQHPEKLIPKLILNAIAGRPLPIYGDGRNVRDWLYVLDNCEAINIVLRKGKVGEVYNVGAGNEKTNLEVASLILEKLDKPKSLIEFVKDRPGHDFRYSLNFRKIMKLGWRPRTSFEEGLDRTVTWYRENEWWWAPLVS
ncbi:MAG: dTDP-glucose 4,6-dehydratase [Candidatus Hadarchaeum yellowstonense]|uniref:dTDP-glucose 4,6-dehydratase n=1 Tax=Hadarchaeum yellowstonense TaxID=1776334 RepID=A0A147JY42_HADYE|nr:MAG: dTDP-glucose 4,6-dehydratase [Candidatus Hadarchaeum yellowstonense]